MVGRICDRRLDRRTARQRFGIGAAGPEVASVQAALLRYGYGIEPTGVCDARTELVVTAFQRHFRAALVNGRADHSTLDTLGRLAAAHLKQVLDAYGQRDVDLGMGVWYRDEEIDASSLWIGLSGLVPDDDPRFLATVLKVESELRSGAVVYRYHWDDGLPGREGGFHICSAWLVEAYLRTGRRADAEELFGQMLNCAGPTGLLPEQYDPLTERGLGNHPQAYSHLGLIILYVAFNLSFSVWLMKGFMDEIPREYEEAALVDGYTRLQAFFKVVLPVATTGIAATAVFCCVRILFPGRGSVPNRYAGRCPHHFILFSASHSSRRLPASGRCHAGLRPLAHRREVPRRPHLHADT